MSELRIHVTKQDLANRENKLYQKTLLKRDRTRLKNLLRNYRDHMITNRINQRFINPEGKNLVPLVDELDAAINLINSAMR